MLNRRLTQLAATDGLTGLTNRRTFDGFLRREYEACEQISVLLFDIDNFKGYNDTYGHQAGDRCLQAVAKVIGDATSNTSGLSARYGGEEFAVVLPNTSEHGALKIAEAIRLTVRALGTSEHRRQSRLRHHQRRRGTPDPLHAGRRRAGRRGRHRALRGQASRPQPQRHLPVDWTCNLSTPHRSSPIRSHGRRTRAGASRTVRLKSEPKQQILILARFLPQISLRNLRKLDCYANRYPLRSKTLSSLQFSPASQQHLRQFSSQQFSSAREAPHIRASPLALSELPAGGAEARRSQMTAIARALSRAFATVAEIEILKQLLLFSLAGLFVSVLLMTYGLDLSPGFF